MNAKQGRGSRIVTGLGGARGRRGVSLPTEMLGLCSWPQPTEVAFALALGNTLYHFRVFRRPSMAGLWKVSKG